MQLSNADLLVEQAGGISVKHFIPKNNVKMRELIERHVTERLCAILLGLLKVTFHQKPLNLSGVLISSFPDQFECIQTSPVPSFPGRWAVSFVPMPQGKYPHTPTRYNRE